jgi:DNA-binding beta-propeller fold protein YncE
MHRFAWVILLTACESGITFPPDSEWPGTGTAPYAATPRFALTVNLEDTLAFVAADPMAAKPMLGAVDVGSIPVELEGPHHIAASPDGRFAYVNLSNYVPGTGSGPHGAHGTGTVPGSLLKIDTRTNRRVGEVLVERSPGEVILSKDGATAYVTHYDLLALTQWLEKGGAPEDGYSSVVIVDTATMSRTTKPLKVCPTTHGAGLSADGKTLYVTCSQSDELAVVDVSDRTNPVIVKKLPVGPAAGPPGQPVYAPYALAVSPKDGTVWLSDNNAGDVRVYDPASGMMDPARTVAVGGVAMFGEFSPDGATFYVPHQGDDALSAIDTTTRMKRDVPLSQACKNAHAFVLAPGGAAAVVVCEGDHAKVPGTALLMTTTPLTIISSTPVGLFPDGAAWLPAVQ